MACVQGRGTSKAASVCLLLTFAIFSAPSFSVSLTRIIAHRLDGGSAGDVTIVTICVFSGSGFCWRGAVRGPADGLMGGGRHAWVFLARCVLSHVGVYINVLFATATFHLNRDSTVLGWVPPCIDNKNIQASTAPRERPL